MKGVKKLLAITLAAAMLLTLVPAVALATTEGSLGGTFTCNSPPSVTGVTLTETAITPQSPYSVTVAVSDADNVDDLNTVVLKVWHDSDAGNPTEGQYEAASADTQTCAIITYTLSGDTFAIDPSASTSWALGSCTAFDAGEKSSTSGDCIFVFTPGKVATQTTGSDNWQVAAQATDSGSQTAFGYDTTPGATMAWYGEVTVSPTSVDFSTLVAGTAFDACTPQTVYDSSGVNYIANGAYDEKVKATSDWSGATLETTEKAPASMTADTFSLKADDSAVLGSAVMVDATGVIIDDTDGQTTEAGDDVDANTLWIQLASSFTAGTYNGTVYYMIAAH